MPKLDENGHEILDGTRSHVPLRFSRVPSALDDARKLVQQAMLEASRVAAEQDFETFDESNDFDVGDDYDPTDTSIYEYTPEQERGFFAAVEEVVTAPPVRQGAASAPVPRPERGEQSPEGPGGSPEPQA